MGKPRKKAAANRNRSGIQRKGGITYQGMVNALRNEEEIICPDKASYAAYLSLKLNLIIAGEKPRNLAAIEKGFSDA